MEQAQLNTISGASTRLDSSGWTIYETAYFRGLIGQSQGELASRAYGILLNNGYFIGAFYEKMDVEFPSGTVSPIVLDAIDFGALTNETQQCTLIWRSRRNGPIRAQFSTGAVSVQTNTSNDGTPIVLQYTYPPDPDIYGEKAGLMEETGVMVDKLMPEQTVDIARTEWGPTFGLMPGADISGNILERKALYEGKINSDMFLPVPNKIPSPEDKHARPGCWLCTGINASTNDSGVTYDVSYSFAFRPSVEVGGDEYLKGWNAEAVFIDPATGRPPKDLGERVSGLSGEAAWRSVQIYDEVAFSGIWA